MTRRRLIKGVCTTGDLARYTGVCARTAALWADRGLIPHYKVPGSQDRRFLPKDVFEFLQKHGIPIPQELRDLLK